jgi:hypothetical protein
MSEPKKKVSPNKGVPHKNTKYSQQMLKELEYDVAVQIKLHLDDLERRIATEKSAYKPRKNLLLELSKEQATMVKALLPYEVVKPTGDSPMEDIRRAPLAIKLSK